ncbi:MAG: SirB2 family protein [Burkholderiaceae bacterium]|nr:SirB2 family protein [Burkholderiaceae bacterium]
MTLYEALKWVHVGCVIASGAGFVARGALMLAGSPLLEARIVRVAPHVIDTVLLASAVTMAVLAQLSLLAHPWLAAKIVALLVYIVLGSLALRRARTRALRIGALAGAVLAFGYIVGVALTRDPLSWLARLS